MLCVATALLPTSHTLLSMIQNFWHWDGFHFPKGVWIFRDGKKVFKLSYENGLLGVRVPTCDNRPETPCGKSMCWVPWTYFLIIQSAGLVCLHKGTATMSDCCCAESMSGATRTYFAYVMGQVCHMSHNNNLQGELCQKRNDPVLDQGRFVTH